MPHIKWPPALIRTDVLGEVRDASPQKFTRDGGRHTTLGGGDGRDGTQRKTFQIYGDTFCHDSHGQFLGVTNNTYALIPDPVHQPTRSVYLDYHPHQQGGSGRVREWIPFTQSEREYTEDPGNRERNDRVVCWSFGGIVEDWEGSGEGWVFFDKLLTHGADIGKQFGVGVARVRLEGDRIRVERPMGDEMIFGENEPRFGSISHLCDDDGYVYLYGSHDPNPQAFDMRMHVARIRRDADFTKKENYQYWINTLDGRGAWDGQYGYLDALAKLGDLDVQQQGAIFKAPDFAPEGKPYMWIGVNKFMVGHLYVGVAPQVHGPWDVQDLGPLPDDPQPFDGKSSGPKYCLYPCPQASDLARGEMLCMWTDAAQLGGKVLAARVWFEGDYERAPPPPPPAPPQAQEQHHEEKHKGGLGEVLKSKMGGLFKR